MTTDNRTNELGKIRQNDAKHFAWSEAQVEAAAKAIADCHNPGMFEKYPENWRVEARAALVAAASVAPQAESGHDWMTWEESGKNGTYCRNCGIWAGKSGGVACAPAQPQSTVDVASLIREAKAEALEEFAGQMATGFNPQTLNAERRAIKREARTRAAEYREGSET